MTEIDDFQARMGMIPRVRRTRGFRLYDDSGRRYLDMYLDGGRAILGHKPSAALKSIKNNLDRGLLAPYPSQHRRRFIKALSRLLPEYPVLYLFPETNSALREINRVTGVKGTFADPALEDTAPGCVSLWRPFLPTPGHAAFLVPVLPLPGSFCPCMVMAGRESPALEDGGLLASPIILAALERSVWDILNCPKEYGEKEWALFPAAGFSRKGPYLKAECGERVYGNLFRRMLGNGILLSPRYPGPSIIPGEYSPGEIKALARY